MDGAQAVPHLAVDVRALGCDFYVFSGHKVFGPTGVGALYGRADLLEAMRSHLRRPLGWADAAQTAACRIMPGSLPPPDSSSRYPSGRRPLSVTW